MSLPATANMRSMCCAILISKSPATRMLPPPPPLLLLLLLQNYRLYPSESVRLRQLCPPPPPPTTTTPIIYDRRLCLSVGRAVEHGRSRRMAERVGSCRNSVVYCPAGRPAGRRSVSRWSVVVWMSRRTNSCVDNCSLAGDSRQPAHTHWNTPPMSPPFVCRLP